MHTLPLSQQANIKPPPEELLKNGFAWMREGRYFTPCKGFSFTSSGQYYTRAELAAVHPKLPSAMANAIERTGKPVVGKHIEAMLRVFRKEYLLLPKKAFSPPREKDARIWGFTFAQANDDGNMLVTYVEYAEFGGPRKRFPGYQSVEKAALCQHWLAQHYPHWKQHIAVLNLDLGVSADEVLQTLFSGPDAHAQAVNKTVTLPGTLATV